MNSYLRVTLATAVFCALVFVPAGAQTVPAEDDTWITGSGTQVDFSNFGNVNITQLLGSQPVNSVVSFVGSPLNSSLGLADTLVSRGPATIASQFSATLSIKGLNLVSSPDMTLQDGRVFHVTAVLSNQNGTGSINFSSTSSEGGTFNSSFTVTPILTFTNVRNSADVHTIDCADPAQGCSFPMTASGNWVQTSSTGFDPQSVGIPTVPSGVVIGNYSTVGRPRFGGIQVGCGGTKSTGYGCGQNNELHGNGSLGQAIHGTKPPNDCAQPSPSPTPIPSPSPTPTPPGGGGGCMSTSGAIVKCNFSTATPVNSQHTLGGTRIQQAPTPSATATLCATNTVLPN